MAKDDNLIKKHKLVPKHTKLSEKATNDLLKKYNILKTQLPKIFVSDPVIKMLGASPEIAGKAAGAIGGIATPGSLSPEEGDPGYELETKGFSRLSDIAKQKLIDKSEKPQKIQNLKRIAYVKLFKDWLIIRNNYGG